MFKGDEGAGQGHCEGFFFKSDNSRSFLMEKGKLHTQLQRGK